MRLVKRFLSISGLWNEFLTSFFVQWTELDTIDFSEPLN
jgi:hypothetical protein